MKEYGSNIQKLVEYIVSIPDKEKRTKHSHILIELMRQIHPQMRDGSDYSKKLWDDLYIMSNFDLDVDSPYPPPSKDSVGKKPKPIPYTQNKLRHKFYGRNLELLVLKAIVAETPEERKAFISYLVKLMKSLYQNYNRDQIDTNSCLNQILELSGGRLKPEIDYLLEHGVAEEVNPRDGGGHRQRSNRGGSHRGRGHSSRNNQNGRSRQSKRRS